MDYVDKFLALAQDLDFLDEDNDEDYNPDDGDETECEGDESDLIDADQSTNDTGRRIDGKDGETVYGDVEEEETEGESETDETGLIAQRTRSKFSLDDAIELDSFNFPDVDSDLYGDSEADHEFLNFCQSIFADDPVEESKENGDSDLEEDDPLFEATLTDDGNDDYLEDLDDRSTTIPEKEIVQLLDELNEIPFEVTGHVGDWVPAWSSNGTEFNSILHSQMTQYVQLLTQSYLLTRDRRTLVSIARNSSEKLTQLDSLPFHSGTMRPTNLTAAVQLVKSKCIKEIKELKRGYNWRPCPLSLETKATIFGHPTIFRIEQLLPKHGYYDLQATSFNGANREKVTFTFAEDYLISLGLFHFSESEVSIVKTCYLKFIIQLLIPIKSESQLRTHIKNVRRRNEKDNPINVYYTKKDVDTFPRFELDTNKTDYDIDLAPDWLKEQILASRPRSRPRLLLPSPIKSTPSSLATHSILKKYQKLNRPNFSPLKDIGNAGWTTSGKVVGGKFSFEGQSDVVGKSGLNSTKSPGKAISGQVLPSDRKVTSELKGKVTLEPEEEEDGADDESQQLAALMAASTTICSAKLKPMKKESKQKVAARQKESTIKIIQESDRIEARITEEMKDEAVIEQIVARSREVFIKECDFIQLFDTLINLSRSRGDDFKTAFDALEQLLVTKNAVDIIDLLVERLDPSDVIILNRSSEYLFMKRFHSFAVKVEAADEALCIKLQKALSGLKQTDAESDLQKIKATVSKVVNGHPYLMAEFLSLFPDEKVASYLVSNEEDFEEMLLDDDDDDFFFDHLLLPDDPNEAKWTTDECPCLCHPQDVASRPPGSVRHCLSCSLRFIDGRIWTVQGNKAELLTIVSKSDVSELSSGLSNDAQDHGINDGKTTVSEETAKWSIEEDRHLLQLFQERLSKNSSESVIEEAAKELGRDIGQVASRFKQLIELLKAESQSTNNCDN